MEAGLNHNGLRTQIGQKELKLAGWIGGIQRCAGDMCRKTQKRHCRFGAVRTDQRDPRRLRQPEARQRGTDPAHRGIKIPPSENSIARCKNRRCAGTLNSLPANKFSDHMRHRIPSSHQKQIVRQIPRFDNQQRPSAQRTDLTLPLGSWSIISTGSTETRMLAPRTAVIRWFAGPWFATPRPNHPKRNLSNSS